MNKKTFAIEVQSVFFCKIQAVDHEVAKTLAALRHGLNRDELTAYPCAN